MPIDIFFAFLGWENIVHPSQWESLDFTLPPNIFFPYVFPSNQYNFTICPNYFLLPTYFCSSLPSTIPVPYLHIFIFTPSSLACCTLLLHVGQSSPLSNTSIIELFQCWRSVMEFTIYFKWGNLWWSIWLF